MADDAGLELLGEKILHMRADPSLVAYCPSMDLVATATADQQVIVHRLNGQRVYSVVQKQKGLKVQGLYWKPNGQLLAIAYDDGVVKLYGAESSKTVHQIVTTTGGVTCIGWVSNITDDGSSKFALDGLNEVGISSPNSEKPPSLDLPRDLALIDIEASMVKLSVLPAGSTSEDVFSSRASLDTLFRSFDPKDNDVVDVMLVGTSDSKVHLSIYDSFEHASHPRFSTHGVLVRSTPETSSNVSFVPIDLRFIGTSDGYLSLLAAKSTQLQNLLRYVNQVQSLMILEYKSTQDLPQRFLGNVNESLAEKYNSDVVHAMYHQVATGHTYPVMKEWLVDELAERGHKRWEKAVTGGYEGLRKLIHEHMLPALERCSLILSRLYGIAKFQSNDELGLSIPQIKKVMDTVSCLSMCSSRILAYTIDELDHFHAFSAWLRHEIDRLASDSKESDDVLEKEAAIEHAKVLHYIQTAMMNSKLSIFFRDEKVEEGHVNDTDGIDVFEALDEQLQRHANGQPCSQTLCKVPGLCQRMDSQAKTVFEHMAETQRRNVFFGKAVSLGSIDTNTPLKMRMCAEDKNFVVYVATSTNSTDGEHITSTIHLHRLVYSIKNGLSTMESRQSSTIILHDHTIEDMEFEDSSNLLLLLSSENHEIILTITYTPSSLEYSSSSKPTTNVLSDVMVEAFTLHSFPANAGFVPGKMIISERNLAVKSRDDDHRVCVLSKDGLVYRIYNLPMTKATTRGYEEDITMSQ